MPRGVLKQNLPSKVCVTCLRPFTWRKAWEKCWVDVLTCSDRCKAVRKKEGNAANRAAREEGSDQVVGPPAFAPEVTAEKEEKPKRR